MLTEAECDAHIAPLKTATVGSNAVDSPKGCFQAGADGDWSYNTHSTGSDCTSSEICVCKQGEGGGSRGDSSGGGSDSGGSVVEFTTGAFSLKDGDDCEITNDGACFQSKNYPRDYANHGACTINILKSVTLEVVEFEVEGHATCDYDDLTVNDNKYCGTPTDNTDKRLPTETKVTADQEIKWKSDGTTREIGFKICAQPSAIVECINKAGLTVNDADCWCSSAENVCTTSTGLFCQTTTSTCATIPVCHNTDATALHTENCQCGSNICDATTGRACNAGTCQNIDACINANGLILNTNTCLCGTLNVCTSTSGQYCHSTNICSPSIACTNTDGTVIATDDCLCGSSDTCTTATGRFCHLQPKLGNPVCSPNIACANTDGTVANDATCLCSSSGAAYEFVANTMCEGDGDVLFDNYYKSTGFTAALCEQWCNDAGPDWYVFRIFVFKYQCQVRRFS